MLLDRLWKQGDVVRVTLPMHVSVRRWESNKMAASVEYGPLTFSLRIDERWSPYGGSKSWPEWEVFPAGPWNYGLVLDPKNPARSFEVVRKKGPLPPQPFRPDTASIELRAKARKIPGWKQDATGLVGKLQPSPVKSEERIENVTLIPMGAARLRITAFPVIGNGSDAHDWAVAMPMPVSASHCWQSDTVAALVDGLEPKNSNDHDVPRFTWWDHRGTREWVQYDFGKPRKVSRIEVYWFDDTGAGSCRVPRSWTALYQDGTAWVPLESASGYGTQRDSYNQVTFSRPVTTTALRLDVQLQANFSGGILEWKVR
jgi:hypothetical protein